MPGKYSEMLHPREKSGPRGGWWSFSPTKIEAAARKAAGLDYGSMASTIQEDGGFSYTLDGKEPTTGFMVGGAKAYEFRKEVSEMTDKDIVSYASTHLRGLMYKDYYLGGWLSGTKACLDVSKNVFTKSEAIRLAIKYTQDSVYIVGDGFLTKGVDYDW